MTENMFDVLGVLIAFITVMLVFSIAITSLVQATQGLLRWRARNLQNGLAKIFQSVQLDLTQDEQADDDKDSKAKEARDDAWQNAIAILNNSDAALLNTKLNPVGGLSRFFGPQLSWMEPDELDRELRKQRKDMGLTDEQTIQISQKFRRSQDAMRKVFLRRIRLATIFWAFVIAFYYQLSTPDLIETFSTDPAARAAAAATAQDILDRQNAAEGDKDKRGETGEDDPGWGGWGYPHHGYRAYGWGYPYAAMAKAEDEQTGNTDANEDGDETASVPYFEMQPWSDGWCFFYHPVGGYEDGLCPAAHAESGDRIPGDIQWKNIVGMLITVLLLSLGAPFWFDMLKSVVNLKDSMAKATGQEEKSAEGKDSDTTTEKATDDRLDMLRDRLHATTNPILKASLQKEINDLRLARAENP